MTTTKTKATLTRGQVAEAQHVSPRQASRWERLGCPSEREGGRVVYDEEAVARWRAGRARAALSRARPAVARQLARAIRSTRSHGEQFELAKEAAAQVARGALGVTHGRHLVALLVEARLRLRARGPKRLVVGVVT